MKYITFGGDGRLNGRYDSDINTVIPVDAVVVEDDLFLLTITLTSGYWELVDGVVTHTIPLPPSLAIVASSNIAATHLRINIAYQTAVDTITAGYPVGEISSWFQQAAEATAWTANNSAPTPWIDAAAAARGITKAVLITLIMGNASGFTPIHGALTGKRQGLRDAIDALGPLATKEQLDAIQW